MNSVQQFEMHHHDHPERLRVAHNSRLARQLPGRPGFVSRLSRSLVLQVSGLFHGQRPLELAQPK